MLSEGASRGRAVTLTLAVNDPENMWSCRRLICVCRIQNVLYLSKFLPQSNGSSVSYPSYSWSQTGCHGRLRRLSRTVRFRRFISCIHRFFFFFFFFSRFFFFPSQLHPVPNFVVHSKRLNLCGCWSRRRSCCLQRGGGCHPSCILFTECCRVIGTCASSAKYTIAYRKPSRHTESSFLPLLTLHGTGYLEVEHGRATLFSVRKFTLYCWW